MDNNIIKKIEELMGVWKAAGIQINKGISANGINECEKAVDFTFAEDFRGYLMRMNGFRDFDSDQEWFSFWSTDRIQSELGDCHPLDLVCFADHSINLCTFGFHRKDKMVYIHYQHSDNVELVARTFTDFINTYSVESYQLLR